MNPIREITKEASRQAVMGMKEEKDSNGDGNKRRLKRKKSDYGPPPGSKIRPVDAKDFKDALQKVKKSGEAASSFRNSVDDTRSLNGAAPKGAGGIDMNELAQGMEMLKMMMSNGSGGNNNPKRTGDMDDIPNLN